MSNYTVRFDAALTSANANVGDVLVRDNSGSYLVANTALLATFRPVGIAVSAAATGQSVALQYMGEISNTVSGLTSGSKTAVRVSSAGRLERVASPTVSDRVVGESDYTGAVTVCFAPIDSYPVNTTGISNVWSVAQGGTGTNTIGAAGTVAVSNGTALEYTACPSVTTLTANISFNAVGTVLAATGNTATIGKGVRVAMTVTTSNLQITDNMFHVDIGTVSSNTTVTLPSSPVAGDSYEVADANFSGGTYVLKVAGGGKNVGSATFVNIGNGATVCVRYNSSYDKWVII